MTTKGPDFSANRRTSVECWSTNAQVVNVWGLLWSTEERLRIRRLAGSSCALRRPSRGVRPQVPFRSGAPLTRSTQGCEFRVTRRSLDWRTATPLFKTLRCAPGPGEVVEAHLFEVPLHGQTTRYPLACMAA